MATYTETCKIYYNTNKVEILSKQASYYDSKKEEIKKKRRERYHRQKALAAVLAEVERVALLQAELDAMYLAAGTPDSAKTEVFLS